MNEGVLVYLTSSSPTATYTADQVLEKKEDVRELYRIRITRKETPFLNTSSVNSTTRSKTPPPGANRRTLGTNPLYRAANPSSRAIVANAGYVQLYFGFMPGIFSAPWMRDFTT